MNLHVSTATIGERIVVAFEGSIDLSSVATLHDSLTRTVRQHRGQLLVVDLDGVQGLDDCALGVLLGAAATAREAGGDLELVVGDGPLRARLERTRLDRAIDVRTTIA